MNPEWMNRSACRDADPSLFDPPQLLGNGRQTREQRRDIEDRVEYARLRYCNACPVIEECAAFGEKNGYGGMWGGSLRESTSPCGTRAGYQAHLAAGTEPCLPCLDANEDRGRNGLAKCGTYAAVRRHRARGETCGTCDEWTASGRRRVPPVEQRRRLPTAKLRPCGTVAGYKRHLARGEQPCDLCRAAKRQASAAGRTRLRKAS